MRLGTLAHNTTLMSKPHLQVCKQQRSGNNYAYCLLFSVCACNESLSMPSIIDLWDYDGQNSSFIILVNIDVAMATQIASGNGYLPIIVLCMTMIYVPHHYHRHGNESTEVQNPRRNSYTQTMDVCITPCTVDISVDSPSLQLYL